MFSHNRPTALLYLLGFLLTHLGISTTSALEGPATSLTSNVPLERPIPEGTQVTLTCSSHGSSGSGVLRILRRRGGGAGIDGFEDLANFATRVLRVRPDRPDIAATFTVSRKDDAAVFICGDVETLGFQSQSPAASVTIRVQFEPRSLSLKSNPDGRMREDMSKVITCQTDEGGANPPVNVTWRHLSPLGAAESLEDNMAVFSTLRKSSVGGGGFVTVSNLTVTAHRRLNGHRIECGVEKPGRVALLRQSETLEVIFAPNSVQIHPSTTGGISEGDVISLTCAVAVSHPPATVRWFEFPPDSDRAPESGHEITDLAQIDMTPGEYGGMLVDSTVRISKTFRSNALTEYRCIVNQAALRNPVVAEYKLNILYPPAVEVVSLPNDPTEGQVVTLSCLTHGGSPEKGFSFSWWHAKDLQFPFPNGQAPGPVDLSPVQAKSVMASLNNSALAEIFSSGLIQLPSQTGRHLMLDAIAIEQTGWYGCQVVSSGGTAHGLHLLRVNYAPRIHPGTKFMEYAQPGMKAEFTLTVDARPARAEFVWFWIGVDTTLASKARAKILSQSSGQSAGLRSRRSLDPLKAISSSVAPWINRVKLTSSVTGDEKLTFSLAFKEVYQSDFGIYLCQINHIAGNREFYFELKPQSHSKGIDPETIQISSEGRKVQVEFEPPNNQFYSRIVLRICLPGGGGGSRRNIRPSGDLVFLRPVVDSSSGPIGSHPGEVIGAVTTGNIEECGDYEVTFAELGFIQVELDRPIHEYSFQFLVFQDTQLQQITRAVRWNADKQPSSVSSSSKLLVQLVIGILITLLIVCLIAFLIYYFCSCIKRKNMKKLAPASSSGLLHGNRTYQTLDSGKNFPSPPSGPGSISADIGLLHPAYARQSIGLGSGSLTMGMMPNLSIGSSITEDNENRRTPASSCQSTKGFYSPQPQGHMTNSAHPLLEKAYHPLQNTEMRGSPSNASHVSALTQRILSEVYIAAAKAASLAVSESLASGSIDAVNHTVGGNGTYRSASNYAESISMIGGSISALDGLGGYTVATPNGMPRMRKSPNARTATPTYHHHGHLTPQPGPMASPHFVGGPQSFRPPRVPSQTGSCGGWASPMLTAQATMRLNEAANALAAAAAAAVLEATGASSDLGSQGNGPMGAHQSRFGGSAGAGVGRTLSVETGGGEGTNGGGNGGVGTSSEDGESISSTSFFTRNSNGKVAGQEPCSKAQRKKLLPCSRKGSLSNNEALHPMLSINTNYPQIIDPRGASRTSSTELTAYLPTTPMEGMWTQNFPLIRAGAESKFASSSGTTGGNNNYSDAHSEGRSNASTAGITSPDFESPSTPTIVRRPPVPNHQPPSSTASYHTDDCNNPNDNTLRAHTDGQNVKPPSSPTPSEQEAKNNDQE